MASLALTTIGSRAKRNVKLAAEQGFAGGPKTSIIRARMDQALIDKAKQQTGITSDTELIEAALATLALEDDYADWLLQNKGTVDPELDLEF